MAKDWNKPKDLDWQDICYRGKLTGDDTTVEEGGEKIGCICVSCVRLPKNGNSPRGMAANLNGATEQGKFFPKSV